MPPNPPPSVVVHRPGEMRQNSEHPNEDFWTFQVTVNGQAGLFTGYFPAGTAEAVAAGMVHQVLTADPGGLKGITSTDTGSSTGGATGGSPGPAGSGETGTGPVIDPDKDKDDKIPKMKTADGT